MILRSFDDFVAMNFSIVELNQYMQRLLFFQKKCRRKLIVFL